MISLLYCTVLYCTVLSFLFTINYCNYSIFVTDITYTNMGGPGTSADAVSDWIEIEDEVARTHVHVAHPAALNFQFEAVNLLEAEKKKKEQEQEKEKKKEGKE